MQNYILNLGDSVPKPLRTFFKKFDKNKKIARSAILCQSFDETFSKVSGVRGNFFKSSPKRFLSD